MKFDVQRVPSDGYWSNYWLKAPVHFGNINPRPTPDILFSLLYKSDAPWNESQYKSEKFDKMLIEARGLARSTKRKEIYNADAGDDFRGSRHRYPGLHLECGRDLEKLKGLEPNPLGGMMGYAFAEYVWLDAGRLTAPARTFLLPPCAPDISHSRCCGRGRRRIELLGAAKVNIAHLLSSAS